MASEGLFPRPSWEEKLHKNVKHNRLFAFGRVSLTKWFCFRALPPKPFLSPSSLSLPKASVVCICLLLCHQSPHLSSWNQAPLSLSLAPRGPLRLGAEGARCCCSQGVFTLPLMPHYMGSSLLLHRLMIQGHDTAGCLQLFQGLLWRCSG